MSDDKNLIQLNDELFTSDVLKTPGVILLDFYADWCGPCQAMMPTLKHAAEEYEGKIRFYKVDADDADGCGALLSQYQIRSIPTTYILSIKPAKTKENGESADIDVEIIEKIVGGLDGITFMDKLAIAYTKATSDDKLPEIVKA